MRNFSEAAINYHRAGLRVIPVWMGDEGVAKFPAWKKWEQEKQTEAEVIDLFSRDCWGIAIICAPDIEVIDIDMKADPYKKIDKEFFDEVFWGSGDEKLLPTCTTVRTKSGGWHLIYRTGKAEGNQKLTMRKESPEAVIETRGPGGLIFAAPTPGYKVMRNSYESIGRLTDQQRDHLINTAKQLSEVEIVKPPPRMESEFRATGNEETPWDAFNTDNDVALLLESYGWKELPRQEKTQYRYFNRPGAKNPERIDGFVVKGKNIFSPFSTSTQFQAGRGYTPFAILAVMEHGGDFSACARHLLAMGYGINLQKQREVAKTAEQEKQLTDLMAFVLSTRFDIHAPINEEEATLTMNHEGKTYKIGGKGMVGGIVGPQKSGKSLITSCLTASALSGKQQMGLNLESEGKRKIWFDTEQSRYFYLKTQERIYHMAGLRDNPPTYETYHLRRLSKRERITAIEHVLAMPGDIELIVLDGLVDICMSFNDEKASEEAVGHLLRWSDITGAMLLTVLHTTKTAGHMRGHLGSILQEKYDFGFDVKKDKELNAYYVKCRDARFAPFPSFTFFRDEKGFPYLEGLEPEARDDSHKTAPVEANYDATIIKDDRQPWDTEIPF